MIVLEFAGQCLALSEDEFEAARERGRKLMAVPAVQVDDEILDAAGMETRTGVPASWWLEAARNGDVPHMRCGKYVRFSLREAMEAAKGKRKT